MRAIYKYGRLYEKSGELFFVESNGTKIGFGIEPNILRQLDKLSEEGWSAVSSFSNLGGFLLQKHVDWDYVLLKPEDYKNTQFTKEQVAAIWNAAWGAAVRLTEVRPELYDEIDSSDFAGSVIDELNKNLTGQ